MRNEEKEITTWMDRKSGTPGSAPPLSSIANPNGASKSERTSALSQCSAALAKPAQLQIPHKGLLQASDPNTLQVYFLARSLNNPPRTASPFNGIVGIDWARLQGKEIANVAF